MKRENAYTFGDRITPGNHIAHAHERNETIARFPPTPTQTKTRNAQLQTNTKLNLFAVTKYVAIQTVSIRSSP